MYEAWKKNPNTVLKHGAKGKRQVAYIKDSLIQKNLNMPKMYPKSKDKFLMSIV
jgi:hypothetical protein